MVTLSTIYNFIGRLKSTLLSVSPTYLTIKKRSFRPLLYGGRYKARTCDPLNVVQVRYQLRQSPILFDILQLLIYIKKATPRFELGDKSFAGFCLTTWPCRLLTAYS